MVLTWKVLTLTNLIVFIGGWVKVGEDPDTSCANFHQFERKTVTAMFSRDEVKGTIKFTQENPYTPTFVTVDLLVSHVETHLPFSTLSILCYVVVLTSSMYTTTECFNNWHPIQ